MLSKFEAQPTLLHEGEMMASLPGDRVSEPQEKGAFDNEAEPERYHLWLSVKGSPQARVFGDLILSRRCCLEGAVEPP